MRPAHLLGDEPYRRHDAGCRHETAHALVLAGGRGSRLRELTDSRAKPAVSFAGNLKIIDFALGNCVNSGVRRIGVLTQYKAQSLVRHVMRGWAFADAGPDSFIDVIPAQQQTGEAWYRGTADAVYQNLPVLQQAHAKRVLVLAGDHVYKMDYRRILADHVERGADITVACIEVPMQEACGLGVMDIDADGRVRAFDEKPACPVALPARPGRVMASMGVYVFSAPFLYQELSRDSADPLSHHDFGHDILPRAVARSRVFAHNFEGSCVGAAGARPYWRDVGTLDAYWQANMDVTRPLPGLDLYDDTWPIGSLEYGLAPARFRSDADGHRGMAIDSLVSSGCQVSGAAVWRSVLSPRVCVGDGSVVEDSLLLPGAVLGRNVVLRRAIVDEGCVLPNGIKVGIHPDEDRCRFTVTDQGVTLVTARMLAP